MKQYAKVLVALALDTSTDAPVVNKAKAVCEQYGGEMTLLHVVEHLSHYGAAYGVAAGVDVEQELEKEATTYLQEAGQALQVPTERQVVQSGPAAQVIIDEAQQRQADLIIVGSHGRHGVRLLLGSTANAVLHGATCDVLAVRVAD